MFTHDQSRLGWRERQHHRCEWTPPAEVRHHEGPAGLVLLQMPDVMLKMSLDSTEKKARQSRHAGDRHKAGFGFGLRPGAIDMRLPARNDPGADGARHLGAKAGVPRGEMLRAVIKLQVEGVRGHID